MYIYIGYKFAAFLAFITPYPVSYFIATVIGKLSYLLNIYVPIMKKNVSMVLGIDIKDKKVSRIVKRIYINWFKTVVDFLKHPMVKGENFKKRVHVEGFDNLKEALKGGKGAIIFTAHLGNIEWGACRVGIEGFKIWATALSRPYEKTNLFFENRRSSKGLYTIYVNKTMLEIFRLLRRNEVIAIPTDFNPTGTSQFFNFFGKKACIPSGAIELALKSGAPILPSFIWRKGKYNYFQVIDKALDIKRDGEHKALVRSNNKIIIGILENYIRGHIEEWEMFHDIWA